jgi:hypothetical protein
MRKDPPFDAAYMHATYLLEKAVLDACAVNWILLSPHGQGMPLLTGNWAFIAMAWMPISQPLAI